MADALCGPTNALTSLQKHSQVDRSLQQDRAGSSSSSASGFLRHQNETFRASSGPGNNAHIEAEFAAFESGQSSPLHLAHHQPQHQQHPAPLHLQHLHHHAHQHPGGLQHAATAPLPQVHSQSQSQSQSQSPALGMPGWAADFQQLSLHEARQSPVPAARFRHEAPMHRPSGGSWHAEFLRHESSGVGGRNATPPPSLASTLQHSGASSFAPGFTGPLAGSFGGFSGQLGQHHQRQHLPNQKVDLFDDAAFAAAFDNAAAMVAPPSTAADTATAASEQRQEQVKEKGKMNEAKTAAESRAEEQFSLDHACVEPPEIFYGDTMIDYDGSLEADYNSGHKLAAQAREETMKGDQVSTQEEEMHRRLAQESLQNNDRFHQEEPVQNSPPGLTADQIMSSGTEGIEQLDPAREADELSRTAGQLLDNLKDEQGEKFAKSSFMALMRQLRDREVRLEGDNFVETNHALHPGGPAYPHDAFQILPPRIAD